MARPANPDSTPDDVQVATKLNPDLATKARLVAMLDGHSSVSPWLHKLITDAVEGIEFQVTRNGKPVTTAKT